MLDRALIGAGIILALLLLTVQLAKAAEIVPAVGITRAVHGDDGDGDEATFFGSLAVRGDLVPALKTEIGVAYRKEERFAGALEVQQWPVTASLWLAPIPALYAGGGLGWYHTTYDYENDDLFGDETEQQFGVHLGGGLRVPLSPAVGLDLNGRYVFMDDLEHKISTDRLDPDFWTTSLGLAFRF
jgi:opacity protein-like surface antigen